MTKRRARHWIFGGALGRRWTVCGRNILTTEKERMTTNWDDVTCKSCLLWKPKA